MSRGKQQPRSASTPAAGLFANSRYAAALGVAQSLVPNGTRQVIRAQLRESVSPGPGVYGFLDNSDELIYVGMSNSLRRRLPSYFSARPSRKKDGRIARHVRAVIWQPAVHELLARLRERELIHQYRPNFNVQGHPVPLKFGFIVLSGDDPPVLTLQSRQPRSAQRVWGPVPLSREWRSALELLNHHFQIRDCPRDTPLYFTENGPIPTGAPQQPCLRVELQSCLAPCVGRCSRRDYDLALSLATAFLDGKSPLFWNLLIQAMSSAAAERKFELAAKLRDRSVAFRQLDEWLRRFHDWPEQATFVYPVASSLDGTQWWLAVRRGLVQFVIPRPKSAAELEQFNQRLQGPEMPKTYEGGVLNAGDFAVTRLLFRWFQKHPDERLKCLTFVQALH